MIAPLAVVVAFVALIWSGFLALVTPEEHLPLSEQRAFFVYLLLAALLCSALFLLSRPLPDAFAGALILAGGLLCAGPIAALPWLLHPLRLWAERTVAPSRYRARRMVEEVTEAAPALLELEPLVAMILERTLHTLGIRWGLFALWDQVAQEMRAVVARGLPGEAASARWPQDHPLSRWLLAGDAARRANGLPESLPGLDTAWIVPVRLREEPVGVFLYGPHSSGQPYTATERDVLDLLAHETSAAVANARLFNMVARARREWLQTFDALSDGVFLHDRQGRIQRANRALARLVGRPFEQIIARPWYELLPAGSEARRACAHPQVAGAAPSLIEYDLSYGERRTLHIGVFPLDEGGESCVHVVRDVTEERALQLQLAQAEKLAAIGQMLSGVAHELNNPLTTIIGFSELLQDADVPAQVRSDLQRISRQAKRSSVIVQGLLAFARQSRVQLAETGVNTLLVQTLEFMQPQLESHGIGVQLDLDAGLPHTLADAGQLQQVFLNLFTNAVQAMSETGRGETLQISTRATPTVIRIAVRDDGPGIPPALMNRIFDPFFSTKKVGEGTGLGLSICYGIVREHGGRIWAESTAGQGSAFHIELPIRHAGAAVEALLPALRLGGQRILVVEDDEPIVALFSRVLGQAGCQVVAAPDGEQGLGALAEGQAPDLIIADLKMPRLDGRGLYERVRSAYPHLAGRFLFVTGDAVRPETQAFLNECKLPYLCKPFGKREIEAAVARALADVANRQL